MNIGFLPFAGVFVIVIGALLLRLFSNKSRLSVHDSPTMSAKSSSPWPRVIACSSVILITMAVTLPGTITNYPRLSGIQEHGRRSEAAVDSIYRRCGRHGCSLYVQYHFSASFPGGGRVVESAGEGYIGPERSDNALFAYAQNTGHVPVAYDLTNIQNSALNFGNSALSGDQARQLISRMKIICVVLLMILAIMAAPLFLAPIFGRKGRRLWQ